uniref:Secreted protein n=1 Tax=Arion vulgaris TaxID=1028688 RepID=A0A0B7BTM5_9EUPU
MCVLLCNLLLSETVACSVSGFVRKSCTIRQPHSLVQTICIQGQDKSRRLVEDSGAVDDQGVLRASPCSVRSTALCWYSPLCPLSHRSGFFRTLCRVQSLHAR